MTEPHDWPMIKYPPIDIPGGQLLLGSEAEQPQESGRGRSGTPQDLRQARHPLHERAILAGVAVDAVFDSVSVATTFKDKLAEMGIIFCRFGEAVQHHPELVKQYMGSVVPYSDNFYATLNSAVFTDGSFVYIPKGVKCPMELSTYFRINAKNTGQFERTLIIADEGAYVSYLEAAPRRCAMRTSSTPPSSSWSRSDNATIKYSTVQNWYPATQDGKGGIYNFVTKRGACRGGNSKITWTQVETGSAITWKYPAASSRATTASASSTRSR
jgi:Fe-S cluster assembly protein SufB